MWHGQGFYVELFLLVLFLAAEMTKKVPFLQKPPKLFMSVKTEAGAIWQKRSYVTNIVTGEAVQWASCVCYKNQNDFNDAYLT